MNQKITIVAVVVVLLLIAVIGLVMFGGVALE